jgi:Tfp pilus assembly protein PilF
MLGLNFLVASQVDQAIDELSKAAKAAGDPLEIHLILGNLYREKGQVGRAIQEHQALLQRPKLRRLEHANVLLCLGLDYRSGGFVDRAIEAFNEVLKLDPDNRYALSNLEKLHEDQHQWEQAYAARQKLAALATGPDGASESPKHNEVLAFLENEFGQAALRGGDHREAARRFDAAIERDPRNVPAHLYLGDVHFTEGRAADAGSLLHAVREADRGQPAELARAARAGAPRRRARTPRPRARSPLRRAGRQPALAGAAPGDLGDAVGADAAAVTRRALRRADARRRLLPRPARLPALPLSLDRVALAVPALPRMEFIRGRAHRSGQRDRRSLIRGHIR